MTSLPLSRCPPATLTPLPSSNPFQTLPLEILQDIHLRSVNFSLQSVCRCLYINLSAQSSRLRFCSYILRHGTCWGPDEDYVRCVQREILQQEWFTAMFAIQLEIATMRKRRNDRSVVGGLIPGPNVLSCLSDVALPSRILQTPWPQDKLGLVRRLSDWGVRYNPRQSELCYKGMQTAVIEGNATALKMLLKLRRCFDHDLFRLVVFTGADPVMVDLLADHGLSLINWDDKELGRWAMLKATDEVAERRRERKGEFAEGNEGKVPKYHSNYWKIAYSNAPVGDRAGPGEHLMKVLTSEGRYTRLASDDTSWSVSFTRYRKRWYGSLANKIRLPSDHMIR